MHSPFEHCDFGVYVFILSCPQQHISYHYTVDADILLGQNGLLTCVLS